MHICPLPESLRLRAQTYVEDEWGGPLIITRGRAHDTRTLPGLIALDGEEWLGTLLYAEVDGECEIVALFSWHEKRGAATALLTAMAAHARSQNLSRIFLITTNDNTPALRFFQRQGYSLCALHLGAMAETLRIKNKLNARGIDNIPLEHEIELERRL